MAIFGKGSASFAQRESSFSLADAPGNVEPIKFILIEDVSVLLAFKEMVLTV